MRQRLLISTALCAAVITPATFADTTVDEARTTALRTSTANSGQPDNLIIGSNGRVTISSESEGGGPAVTIDSDSDFTNNGTIEDTTGGDNVTALLINGGTTSNVINNGRISLSGTTFATDTDGDGDPDGAGTTGENRVGILVDDQGTFTGTITNGEIGVIDVNGNNSAGIRTLSLVDGSIINEGAINVFGANSYGIDIAGGLTGDIRLNGGLISATGENSSAVRIRSDIAGIFLSSATLSGTGYRYVSNPDEDGEFVLDEDDTLSSSAVLYIGGSLGRGLYLAGSGFTGGAVSRINQRSAMPALWIAPTEDNASNIVLGLISIPGDPNDENSEDFSLNYGFVNEGLIEANGIFDGFTATAVLIEGRMVGNTLYTTTLEGGLLNSGTVLAISEEGEATAFQIGRGASMPVFENSGIIRSTTFGQNSNTLGIVILEGANVPILRNSNTLSVISQGAASATGIVDQSNTLGLIQNTGAILATVGGNSTVFPTDSASSLDGGTPANSAARTAIDVSSSTIDVTFQQLASPEGSAITDPAVRGDIRLGSGNDTVDLQAGFIDGDIYFGAGADTLTLDNGAAVIGSLNDSDGDLSITVNQGQIELQNTETLQLREAIFNDGSRLIFDLGSSAQGTQFINASETVTINDGTTITASLDNLIGEGAEFIVLAANNLVINAAIDSLQDTSAPYLYNTRIDRDPNDANQLVLTLRRKSSDELGMHENRAAAYEAAFTAWTDREELGAAFASLSSAADFFEAYDQLLPEYAASAIQFAVASNDSAIGALSSRLDAARRSPDQTAGIWIQEFGYFADREQSAFGPGYRGQGVGVAAGIDRPFGPFYAVGLNLVGAASDIEESNGVDEPMTALTGQLGVYGGVDFGGAISGEFYAGAGVDSFETERRVLIGAFDQTATADWTGYHYAGSARFTRDFEVGNWYMRPAVSVDYLRLFESAYSETGGGAGIDLIVDDRETSTFSSTASFTVGGMFGSRISWWSPQLRLGYRNDFSSEAAITNARFAGYNNEFSFRSEDLPGSGLIAGFGIQAGSEYSTFSFDYDADLRDGFVRHTARLVLRLVF
ncbi:autotransporter domain-containing protein [Hyphobacterium sp.]|uniref:autotransporter family protein n=1 Tax=Hyphobacterium sp. TaxID=2004662 RepID=UPI003BAB4CE9